MKRAAVILALAAAVMAGSPARAVQPDEIMADPVKEGRARDLSKELRCMVCQNQSIDDSDAPLARDLRLLVRDRLKAGDSDRQVIEFLTARYGDFVLLNPRLTWRTALLWTLPAVVLLAGGVGLVALFRRRRREIDEEIAGAASHGLSADEQARIAALLKKLPE